MSSSPAPRWWSRLLRKQLLVAAAIGVIVLAVCAPAFADDTVPAVRQVPADTTALARASIVAGRLDEALRILNKVIVASERPEEERATAAEVRAVVDRWVALGGAIAPRSAAELAPLPGTGTADATASTPDAWESSFAVSRARLVAGNFQDAGPGFSLLIGSARTQHQWQRAYALASLSSELVAKDLVLRVGRAASPATAGAAVLPASPAPQKHSHWYGWQTLIVDGMSLLVMPVVAGKAESTSALYLAVGGYALGGPVVHLAHGEIGRAAGSLGLRVAMPFLGALAGVMVQGDCRGDFGCIGGAVIGGSLGVVAAVVIDSAVLAYERVEDEPAVAKTSPKRSGVALSPLAGPRKEGGFDVGVGGTF